MKSSKLSEQIKKIAKLYREADKETKIKVGEKMLGGKIYEPSNYFRKNN